MYEPQPNDVKDTGGRQLVRARYIEPDGHNGAAWLVYASDGDTCGTVLQDDATTYVAHSYGTRRGARKTLNAAIALLLRPDERKEFLGA